MHANHLLSYPNAEEHALFGEYPAIREAQTEKRSILIYANCFTTLRFQLYKLIPRGVPN